MQIPLPDLPKPSASTPDQDDPFGCFDDPPDIPNAKDHRENPDSGTTHAEWKSKEGVAKFRAGPVQFSARLSKTGFTDKLLAALLRKGREFVDEAEEIIAEHFQTCGAAITFAESGNAYAVGANATTTASGSSSPAASPEPDPKARRRGRKKSPATARDLSDAMASPENQWSPRRKGPWRDVPLRELGLDGVRGVTLEKAMAIEKSYPTIGNLADLSDIDAGTGLLSLDGVGKKKATDIKARLDTFIEDFDPVAWAQRNQPQPDDELDEIFGNDEKNDASDGGGGDGRGPGDDEPINVSSKSAPQPAPKPSPKPHPQPSVSHLDAAALTDSDKTIEEIIEILDQDDSDSVYIRAQIIRALAMRMREAASTVDEFKEYANEKAWESGRHARSNRWGLGTCPWTGTTAVDWVKGFLYEQSIEPTDKSDHDTLDPTEYDKPT